MSHDILDQVEPAVPETHGEPKARRGVSRRDFIIRTAGGLTLGFLMQEFTRVELAEAAPAGTGAHIMSFLTVASDNTVTLSIGASEMGQGSYSGLAQILSEELMADYARILTVQAPPALTSPAPVGTAINTVGSSVTRTNFWKVRDAGAAAREMLVQAAMNRQGDLTRANYTVTNGVITHTSGRSYTYGDVAVDASQLPVPVGAPLVPEGQFKVIGRTMPRLDIPSKVDGSAVYGIDVRVPNMVYAVIKHCPTIGGTLATQPGTPSGMLAVVPTQVVAGTGRGAEQVGNINAVAVVGRDTWTTWQAAKRLSVSWTLPSNASTLNDANFDAQATALLTGGTPYVAGAANPPGTVYTVEGNRAATETAIAGSAKPPLDVTYSLPYVAHACMEVLNCTVDYVANDHCTIWAPTQSAKQLLTMATAITGLPADRITVNTTYLGGGLGRKAELDFVSQAIQVAMRIGRPVKLMWPREEDFTHDQYRPMAKIRVQGGLTSGNGVTGVAYRNVSPSILGQRGAVLLAPGDSQGIEGARDLPYNFGTRVTEWVAHPSPVPVGFWRSVGASLNTFAVESFIDELANQAKVDPYQFRRGLLTDSRWLAVLDAVAQLSGWGGAVPSGRFRGIAIGSAFGSIVAQVVEVSSVTSLSLKVNRVWIALDCYVGVNPGQIEAQLTGGMVHGMNAALWGRQKFVNGVAQNKNFSANRMMRPSEMPTVAVTVIPNPAILDRRTAIGGVGELGVPTFAPALANAVFKATGQRVRSLPFFPTATMGGL